MGKTKPDTSLAPENNKRKYAKYRYSRIALFKAAFAVKCGASIRAASLQYRLPAPSVKDFSQHVTKIPISNGLSDFLSQCNEVYDQVKVQKKSKQKQESQTSVKEVETHKNPVTKPVPKLENLDETSDSDSVDNFLEDNFIYDEPPELSQDIFVTVSPEVKVKEPQLVDNICCTCLYKVESDLEHDPISINFLKEFLNGNLPALPEHSLKICQVCQEFITKIKNFKNTCLESMKQLKEMTETKVEKKINEIIDENNDMVLEEEIKPSLEPESDNNDNWQDERNFSRSDDSDDSDKPLCKFVVEKRKKSSAKAKKINKKLKRDLKDDESDEEIRTKSYCSYCTHFFPESLEDHFISFHGNQTVDHSFECKECQNVLLNREDFCQHFDTVHIRFPESEKCPHCTKTFEFRQPYHAHVAKHTSEFKCERCNSHFLYYAVMREHFESRHLGLKHCGQCSQAFASEEMYEKHVTLEHVLLQQYTCDKCGRGFVDKEGLRKHLSLTAW